tara:strand:+ start:698 stop:1300 length:603 start_codon:yes stop_codon:yes gene_type:complete
MPTYKLGSKVGKEAFSEVIKPGLAAGDPEGAKKAKPSPGKIERAAKKQARVSKRKYGGEEEVKDKIDMMGPGTEEAKSYQKGMSEGLSEKKMVKKGLISAPTEHHRYGYSLSGKISRDEGGYYKEIPKTVKITGVPSEKGENDGNITTKKRKLKETKYRGGKSRGQGRYGIGKGLKAKNRYVKKSGKGGRTTFKRRGRNA